MNVSHQLEIKEEATQTEESVSPIYTSADKVDVHENIFLPCSRLFKSTTKDVG